MGKEKLRKYLGDWNHKILPAVIYNNPSQVGT